MKLKKLGRALLSSTLVASLMLSPMPFRSLNVVEAKVAGNRLTAVTLDDSIQAYLDIPSTLPLQWGSLALDKEKVMRKLFFGWNKKAISSGGGSYLASSSLDVTDYYYAQDLPFYSTLSNGGTIPLYCGQTRAADPDSLVFAGVVNDPRVYALFSLDDPSPTTIDVAYAGRELSKQILLWAALNTNWDPNMFSKALNTNVSDFDGTGYGTAIGYVGDFESNWSKTIAENGSVEVKPIQPASYNAYVATAPASKAAVAQISWEFVDGGSLQDLNQVATITYEGLPSNAQVLHGYDSATATKLGYPSTKPNVDYIYFTNTSGGNWSVTPKVTYKGAYKYMNDFVLAYYEGSTSPDSHQPFIAPVPTPSIKPVNISFTIEPCTTCVDPNVPTPSGNNKTTDLRWYNMPSAFGEIKNGIGYNADGPTVSGSFAATRAQEPFEAMLGVPSTERFYVNLGGTEGFIDVNYKYAEATQTFVVSWSTPWYIPPPPPPPGGSAGAGQSGTEFFDQTNTVNFKSLHLENASFRVFGNGQAANSDLGISVAVTNSSNLSSSFTLQPKSTGLQIGPNAGTANYNMGTTTAWKTSVPAGATPKITGRVATRSDGQSTAYSKANSQIGQAFAQNDALTITIAGKQYVFVPSVNMKTATIFGGSTTVTVDATDGQGKNYFKPVAEKWDIWSHVPIKGYNGNPEDNGSRNIGGTILKAENIDIDVTKGNGTYPFQNFADKNYVKYEAVTTVKGSAAALHKDVSELDSGNAKGTSAGYNNAKDPTSAADHISGNNVLTQYTNWQVPETSGENSLSFKHSGKKPDGNLDKSTGDNPAYKSINPIVIHDPVSSMYAWISDIPSSQLQDQRIVASAEAVSVNPRATASGGATGPARQYIDYDFKISMPNTAAFNRYWSQASTNSTETGIVDPDFTSPGTIGKGYNGSALSKVTTRSYNNPYLNGGGQWDISKWINAKYVKFPYGVYYYKNSGEVGGSSGGFYAANSWIQLYDDNQSVRTGDTTEFNFHVVGDARDIQNGIVYFVSEAINAPAALQGEPDALYAAAEQYTNGTRKMVGASLGSYRTKRDGEAAYSAANSVNVDVVGRIGNVLVSDSTDPAWSSVFWKTNNGQIQTQDPTHRDYGLSFNMFDSLVNPNSTGFPAFDRFGTISAWHGESEALHTLPIGKNILTNSQTEQTMKLGYSIGGSVQTLGDYDYSMWIYPQNTLAGTFRTGKPGDPFKLMTADQYTSGAPWKEYYNSDVNNTISSSAPVLGRYYTPTFKYNLSSTLADPRMKISPWEVRSPEYKDAVRKGTTSKVITGSPAWLEIPQALRTWLGSFTSSGKWGLPGINGNNALGSKTQDGTCNCARTLTNVQKWNWNYNLPQNTKIWFYNNAAGKAKDGSPLYESASKDQYVLTSMVFRTKAVRTDYPGSSDSWQTGWVSPAIAYGDHYQVYAGQSVPDWDLTMFTNTGSGGLPDIVGTAKDLPNGLTVGTGQNGTWDPRQGTGYSSPRVPIVFWNYSQSASTDKDNVGTH